MELYQTTALAPEHRGAVIMIGNFDGIHLGHQVLINTARDYAQKHQCPLGVLTFEPHPRLFLTKTLSRFY